MAKKQIRTKYIKSLMEDKASLANTLEESTKETLSAMLDESVNKSLRQMLAESDDDSYEEEVDPTETQFNDEPENDNTEDTVDVDLESGDANVCKDGECNTEGDDVWAGLEDCRDEDGEYDLRGKDIDTVLEILNTMEPDEDIRIIKNDDDTATVVPSGDENEFVIDINNGDETEPNEFEADGFEGAEGDLGNGDDNNGGDDLGDAENNGTDDEDETEFELTIDDDDNDEENNDTDMLSEGNVNLGYTDNYQNKTAMTMPSDKGEGEGDSRFDGGAPKGGKNNVKRWVGTDGANGGNPYSQKTKQPMTEEFEDGGDGQQAIFEVELDGEAGADMDNMPVDETHTRGMARKHNSVGRTEVPDTNVQADEEDTRNVYVNADQRRNCSRATNESVEAKLNAIMDENAQLRSIMAQFKEKLDEAVVINSCLAKATKLFTENSTTREEKINILNRFNKVHTINESKALYNQISGELKNAHSVNNNLLNNQLTEAKGTNKNMIVETNMLGASEELRRILDLQDRMANK